ncbi:MAG: mechanosensitive ion channel family protein [Planctomycetota bacterium]|jgi:small conductance mechanosensitive channel
MDETSNTLTPAAEIAGTIPVEESLTYLDYVEKYGVPFIGALLVLIVGWIVAKWVARATRKGLTKAKVDETLVKFFGNLAKWAVLVFALLACFKLVGVELVAFVGVIAASAFAIGLAFQGSLSNFAAGVMLLVFRPFKVGDVVSVAGHTGKVDEIELFTTTMDTPDNRRLILPNGSIFGSAIENITHHPIRRVDVAVGTDYSANLDQTREILLKAAVEIPNQASGKEPQVVLGDLGASSVDWQVRGRVETSNYWPTKEALTRSVKNALDEADIGIPFPHMDVHMAREAAPAEAQSIS